MFHTTFMSEWISSSHHRYPIRIRHAFSLVNYILVVITQAYILIYDWYYWTMWTCIRKICKWLLIFLQTLKLSISNCRLIALLIISLKHGQVLRSHRDRFFSKKLRNYDITVILVSLNLFKKDYINFLTTFLLISLLYWKQ